MSVGHIVNNSKTLNLSFLKSFIWKKGVESNKKVIKKKASQAVWNAKLLPFLENLHSDFKAFNRVTVADLEINTKGYD